MSVETSIQAKSTLIKERENMKVRRLILCSSALALSLPAAVFGQVADQSAPQSADAGPEEIVVTAQFRQQNLQDTPIAI
ncbi:MAG: hypothetical protein J0G94_03655, partial [Sphingomonadales bacterium]|nr:hypothetical protein [Sphingomonadales bacterium]